MSLLLYERINIDPSAVMTVVGCSTQKHPIDGAIALQFKTSLDTVNAVNWPDFMPLKMLKCCRNFIWKASRESTCARTTPTQAW